VTVVLVISGVERFDNFVIVCGEALRTDPPWRADNTHKCGVVDQRSRPDVFLYSDRADGVAERVRPDRAATRCPIRSRLQREREAPRPPEVGAGQ